LLSKAQTALLVERVHQRPEQVPLQVQAKRAAWPRLVPVPFLRLVPVSFPRPVPVPFPRLVPVSFQRQVSALCRP